MDRFEHASCEKTGAVVGERVYRVRQHGVGYILRPGHVGGALRAEERGGETYLLGLRNIFVRAVGATGPAERAIPIRLGMASDAPSSSSTCLFFQLGCRAAIPPCHLGSSSRALEPRFVQ